MLYKNYKWLRQKYIDEKLSTLEIAHICGCTDWTIRYWLKKFKIKTRTLSEAAIYRPGLLWESRKKISNALKGNKHFLGHKHTKEARMKIGEARKGRPLTEEHKRNLSKNHRDMRGEKNHNWKGGISLKIYGSDFNEKLRKRIRERDGNICQFCGKRPSKEKTHTHHIDYDKRNNDELNLISLCRSHNMEAEQNKDKWQFLFESYQEIRLTRHSQ